MLKQSIFITIFILMIIYTNYLINIKTTIKIKNIVINAIAIKSYYYIAAIVLEIIYIFCNLKELQNFTIYKSQNFEQKNLNLIIMIVFLVIIIVLADWLCISSNNIKSISILGNNLTLKEQDDFNHYIEKTSGEKELLYAILLTKGKMIQYIQDNIDEWMENNKISFLDMYYKIIDKYSKVRNKITIYRDIYNKTNLNSLENLFVGNKLTEEAITTIEEDRAWKVIKDNGEKVIFARISLINCNDDILVILSSKLLIDNEYIILIELIDYLEMAMISYHYGKLLDLNI